MIIFLLYIFSKEISRAEKALWIYVSIVMAGSDAVVRALASHQCGKISGFH